MDLNHHLNGVRETFDNNSKISYFSDFIFVQQMMTLEIDIILGITDTQMKRERDQSEKFPLNMMRKGIECHEPFDMNM